LSACSGGGGGSGYPASNGGFAAIVIPPGDNYFSAPEAAFSQGSAGGFGFAGSGNTKMLDVFFNPISGPPVLVARVQSQSGSGGFSNNGINANTTGSFNATSESSSIAGSAGPAFKGSNITVYNLAADSSKLRDGNSDSYTLITS
jgi:hypothetical protein